MQATGDVEMFIIVMWTGMLVAYRFMGGGKEGRMMAIHSGSCFGDTPDVKKVYPEGVKGKWGGKKRG